MFSSKHYFSLLFMLFIGAPEVSLHAEVDPKIVLSAKKSVVSIERRSSHSAYEFVGAVYGSGFIIDKEQGLIATNHHVVGRAAVSTYDVGFFNGTETTAQLLYYDSWQDFAFLKVDPKTIPSDTPTIKVNSDEPALGESVFIVGKNAGQNYSLQTGELSSHYDNLGHLPNQSYRISLNARGGSSGSPVLNKKGEVIGIIHSSNYDNFGFALPVNYIIDAYHDLKAGQKPKRRSPGMLTNYYSLDKAAKHYQFPQKLIAEYLQSFPNSFNRVLMISSVFKDSPAFNKLLVGDIIWKVNGKEMGPKLYEMEKALNNAPSDKVIISVYRQGKLLDVEVGLYDLQSSDIKRMVLLGGALFYEANDFIRYFTNTSKNAIFLTNIREGSSFSGRIAPVPNSNVYMLNITGFSGKEVHTLDDLIKIVPELMKMKDFNMTYRNYGAYITYDNVPMFSHTPSTSEISLNEIDGPPVLFEFDETSLNWTMKPLAVEQHN